MCNKTIRTKHEKILKHSETESHERNTVIIIAGIPLVHLIAILFLFSWGRGGGRLFEVESLKSTFGGWGGGGGSLFVAERLLTVSPFRVGTYSRLGA